MMSRFFLAAAVAFSLAASAAQAEPQAAASVAAASAGGALPAPASASAALPAASAPIQPAASGAASSAPMQQATPGVAPASVLPAPVVSAAPISAAATSPAGSLLQTIFALCLVLALLAGLAWFLKRYGPKASGGPAHLRIVGALNLGGRERIMVVEVGDQWIVVGASPGRVNALATMPKQEGLPPSGPGPQTLPATGFSEWLKQTIDKRNAQ